MNNKVIILGFDGAAMPLIEQWAEAGELPYFAQIMKEGSWGLLRSTPNFGSASAWPSFYTGLNPGRHGMFDFLYREADTYNMRWTTKRHFSGTPFWHVASDQGIRSAIINMPVTYPTEPFNGIQVAGWMTPKTSSPGFTHPAELAKEIEKSVGKHIFAPSVKAEINRGNYLGAVDSMRKTFEYKLALSAYLMDKYPVDLFCAAWIATDQAGHYFWHLIDPRHPKHDPEMARKFGDAMLEVYKMADEAVQKLHRKFGGTLLIMSDHGHGANPLGEPHLKSLLKQTGFLKMKGGAQESTSNFSRLVGKSFDALQGVLGRPIKRFLIANFPGLLDFALTHQNLADVDWSRTSVYTIAEPTLNLQGREPEGIIPPSEREPLLKQIEGILYSVRDTRTGEKAIDKIYRKEEVYQGEYLDNVPDLLIIWNPDIVVEKLEFEYNGRKIVTEAHYNDYRTGNHRPNGIFFIQGDGVKSGFKSDTPGIIDLCPTILHLCGCSIPDDLDGRFLDEFFRPEFIEHNPPRYFGSSAEDSQVPDYSTPEEKEAAQKRLRDLGYL